MKNTLKFNFTIMFLFAILFQTQAQNDTTNLSKGFYVKPYFGGSFISSFTGKITDDTSQNFKVTTSSGFDAGINLGYDFGNNFGVQLGWEYKTNDIEATFDSQTFKGDYASNMFTLEALYTFKTTSKFKPYIGAGLSLIQEIDTDYSQTNQENSYSTSSDIGFQGFIGLNYELSENWALLGELRNTRFTKIDMKSENTGNSATLTDLKYNPTTFNIGVKYIF